MCWRMIGSYLQNLHQVGLDVWPKLLNHPVDELDPMHVRMYDPWREPYIRFPHIRRLVNAVYIRGLGTIIYFKYLPFPEALW